MLGIREEELRQQFEENRKLERDINKLKRQNDNIKQERDGLKKRRKYLGERYDWIIDNAVRPYAKSRGIRWNDTTDESIDAVIRPLFEDASEAQSLRQQVQTLQELVCDADSLREQNHTKKEASLEVEILREQVETLQNDVKEIEILKGIVRKLQTKASEVDNLRSKVQLLQKDALAKVEKIQAVPDTLFAQDFRVIVSLIKSLSRSIRPTAEIDIVKFLNDGVLLNDVPIHQWCTRAQKKCLVEAWVWSVLIDLVFLTPFNVFHHNGAIIGGLWFKMFGADGVSGWPSPSPHCEHWRCSTMEQLMENAGRAAITHGEIKTSPPLPEGGTAQRLEMSAVKARAEVADIILSRVLTISQASDLSQIPKVVDKAFALALDMSLQRSRLQITFPAIGTRFDQETMLSFGDRSGEDFAEGEVAFIINPGLTKWGDAEGRMLDQRYDIVPALVQLKPVHFESIRIKQQPSDE
jgi:hypothetical protein